MPGLIQRLHVESDTNENLRDTLSITLSHHPHGATHYEVHKNTSGYDELKLYWCNGIKSSSPLPYGLDTKEKLFTFVRDWLSDKERRYQQEPDTDGSCNKGWRVVAGDGVEFYAICIVKTEWIVYHK